MATGLAVVAPAVLTGLLDAETDGAVRASIEIAHNPSPQFEQVDSSRLKAPAVYLVDADDLQDEAAEMAESRLYLGVDGIELDNHPLTVRQSPFFGSNATRKARQVSMIAEVNGSGCHGQYPFNCKVPF